jgi:hypothetical protein
MVGKSLGRDQLEELIVDGRMDSTVETVCHDVNWINLAQEWV